MYLALAAERALTRRTRPARIARSEAGVKDAELPATEIVRSKRIHNRRHRCEKLMSSLPKLK